MLLKYIPDAIHGIGKIYLLYIFPLIFYGKCREIYRSSHGWYGYDVGNIDPEESPTKVKCKWQLRAAWLAQEGGELFKQKTSGSGAELCSWIIS